MFGFHAIDLWHTVVVLDDYADNPRGIGLYNQGTRLSANLIRPMRSVSWISSGAWPLPPVWGGRSMLGLRQDHFLRYGRNQNIPPIVRDQPLVLSLGVYGFGQQLVQYAAAFGEFFLPRDLLQFAAQEHFANMREGRCSAGIITHYWCMMAFAVSLLSDTEGNRVT